VEAALELGERGKRVVGGEVEYNGGGLPFIGAGGGVRRQWTMSEGGGNGRR
jgi:hypothetical protein